MHEHAAVLELGHRGVTVRVVAERGEEVDVGPELGQHDRGYAAAAARAQETLLGLGHLSAAREARHQQKVHPLHVSHDGDASHCPLV